VSETFDLAFMSELDPFWDSAEWSNLFSPEVFLFTNPIAQAACMGDAAMAAVTGFGLDTLFWCSGSQGSVYPICGHQSYHQGGIDASLAIVHKAIFKLHRMGIAQDTSTPAAMCGSVIQPILRKKQYKQQMLYPVSQTKTGHGLGVPSIFWGAGREFPYKGEDFSYLMWRKRSCCAL
jgi:conjugal transfer pilus assembly protein TraU